MIRLERTLTPMMVETKCNTEISELLRTNNNNIPQDTNLVRGRTNQYTEYSSSPDKPPSTRPVTQASVNSSTVVGVIGVHAEEGQHLTYPTTVVDTTTFKSLLVLNLG